MRETEIYSSFKIHFNTFNTSVSSALDSAYKACIVFMPDVKGSSTCHVLTIHSLLKACAAAVTSESSSSVANNITIFSFVCCIVNIASLHFLFLLFFFQRDTKVGFHENVEWTPCNLACIVCIIIIIDILI